MNFKFALFVAIIGYVGAVSVQPQVTRCECELDPAGKYDKMIEVLNKCLNEGVKNGPYKNFTKPQGPPPQAQPPQGGSSTQRPPQGQTPQEPSSQDQPQVQPPPKGDIINDFNKHLDTQNVSREDRNAIWCCLAKTKKVLNAAGEFDVALVGERIKEKYSNVVIQDALIGAVPECVKQLPFACDLYSLHQCVKKECIASQCE